MEEKLANPGPLGLMGFGMTTVLLNIHNAGFFPIGSMMLAMGLCYGGLAQIIAGILEYKKGKYIWGNCIYFIRPFLVDTCIYSYL
ncbi:MAG TPA: acetate uptake transporter [Syntrophorhabdaceae bacterium]|nr:acetate uptake transporter [Syntrophorhabdaceae bacterium]HOL05860.1 acetate uptake transporter [Syntrophorhabdaceae bacterium]